MNSEFREYIKKYRKGQKVLILQNGVWVNAKIYSWNPSENMKDGQAEVVIGKACFNVYQNEIKPL